ncbi:MULTISPECIES: hypothetical protein [unclassified Spirillospora]|uniref:hypothetical protein n=1 Tax=unclassified Spirillospora TaxID=2642701 RepID=UPI003719A903
MGSENRSHRVRARGSRRNAEDRAAALPGGSALGEPYVEHGREGEGYARQAMVSSAQAHDRAAMLLERMAIAHPEEAESHLQSATRHRMWAENDRRLAEEYGPRGGDPDGS